MTKKLKAFSHALRSCENEPHLPLFASAASKKQVNAFFIMYLEDLDNVFLKKETPQ